MKYEGIDILYLHATFFDHINHHMKQAIIRNVALFGGLRGGCTQGAFAGRGPF